MTKILHVGMDRIRIRAPVLVASPELAQRVGRVLGRAAGVRRVALNPLTGNLLVEFDSSAWRTVDGTRALLTALAELMPDSCSTEMVVIPWEDSSATRDAIVRALESAPGIAQIHDDPQTRTLHVRFDQQSFALEPVLRALLGRGESANAS